MRHSIKHAAGVWRWRRRLWQCCLGIRAQAQARVTREGTETHLSGPSALFLRLAVASACVRAKMSNPHGASTPSNITSTKRDRHPFHAATGRTASDLNDVARASGRVGDEWHAASGPTLVDAGKVASHTEAEQPTWSSALASPPFFTDPSPPVCTKCSVARKSK